MDSEILTDEKPGFSEPQTIDEAQAKIDALFSQYETVVVDEPKPTEQSTTVPPTTETIGTSKDIPNGSQGVDPAAPFGYYMKGKKKGQPRHAPYTPIGARNFTPQQANAISPQIQGGILITGGLFLTLINLIIPLLVSVLNNWLTDTKIKPEQMQLDKAQLKELDPVCDAVMKQMSMTGNPMVLLFIGLFSAYGLKFMDLKLNGK